MDDPYDPFYSPKHKPLPPRVARPGELLWEMRVKGIAWRAELRYHGEWGCEAQIFRQGELWIGRRIDTRQLAVNWAELEHAAYEKGDE